MLIRAAAVWYFLGLLCFYHIADFSNEYWAESYYIWDKGKDVLFSAALTYCLPKYGKQFRIIFYFSVIRFLWEVAAYTIHSDINNSKVIDWILILCLGIFWLELALKKNGK